MGETLKGVTVFMIIVLTVAAIAYTVGMFAGYVVTNFNTDAAVLTPFFFLTALIVWGNLQD